MYKTAATKIITVVAFVSTSIITFTVRRITTPKSVFPIVLLNTLTLTIYTHNLSSLSIDTYISLSNANNIM